MTKSKYRTPLTILLVAITAVSGIIAWSRYSASKVAEISISSPSGEKASNEIYIGGAVNSPGFYPLKAEDSIETLIQAAGGTTLSASSFKLVVSEAGEEAQPQRINLNQAESWLLEALPGIGKERAQAIIAYRHQNGPFQSTNELTKVEGIGAKTYEGIKHLITVAD
jgi:competence protein ComEA